MGSFYFILWLGLIAVDHHRVSAEDQNFWLKAGEDDIRAGLLVKNNVGIAKNVIIFIGDGMGPTTVTASRIYRAGETSRLIWEEFDHLGISKTYSANKKVPDSASTATAIYTGVKVNQNTLGVDYTVTMSDCEASLKPEARLKGIGTWAQEAGKSTGIVTLASVTDATPGAFYAHSANRNWESNTDLPANASSCKDIARQLVEDSPGRNLNVIMGGGRQFFTSNPIETSTDPISTKKSVRSDGRNLIEEWTKDKAERSLRHKYINTTKDLNEIDFANIDYLFGLFANYDMHYDDKRDKTENGSPTLEEMALAAIQVLQKNDKGFVLMIEGALIDKAHHEGWARRALEETLLFNDAINATMRLLTKLGIKDETLVVVTSDHAHTLNLNGYPDRSADILGIAEKSDFDDIPYTSLSYGTGPSDSFQYSKVNDSIVRNDPSYDNLDSFEYVRQALVRRTTASHGGQDVNIYATGPMAHLFHRVHEESYIAHVAAYASQIGHYATPFSSSSSTNSLTPSHLLSFALIYLIIRCRQVV